MSSKQAPPAGRTVPIAALNTPLATAYWHLQPVLVLSVLYRHFDALVTDPVSTLSTLLLYLTVSHSLYTILCLPPVARPTTTATTPKKKPAGSTSASPTTLVRRIITAVLSSLLALLAGTPLAFATAVLFGAPLSLPASLSTSPLTLSTAAGGGAPETFLFAAHLALLAGQPLVYTRGVDPEAWRLAGALALPLDDVMGGAVGALLGAWFGAVPIPLDWDRDWQRWPVTVVTGAYLGWALGRYAGRYWLHGKSIDLSG